MGPENVYPGRKERPLDVVSIAGNPTEQERRAAEEGLAKLIEAEREATAPALWARAGRGEARRLGMYDYRDRFSRDDAWRLSARFPAGGQQYAGLFGRGDAK